MNCRRSQELLTDSLEGRLAAPLEHSLKAHLAECDACRSDYESLRAVVGGLKDLSVPEPPNDLTARILDRTRPELRALARELAATAPPTPVLRLPASTWLAAAAVIALLLLWRPPALLSDWSSGVSRTARQAYSYGVRTYHQSERWLDDLNVLRMTVGVAFEDRLDRLNEQLRSFSDDEDDADESDSDQSSRSAPRPTIARLGEPPHPSSRSLS